MGERTYKIMAGRERRGTATTAFLDKNGQIKGEEKEVEVRVGIIGIPNGTEAWGIRLNAKGEIPKDKRLNVDDNEYTGRIEWVKWGDTRGTLIQARYVPGCHTLDREYQKLRLRVEVKDQDEFAALITMQHGYNEYDETTKEVLIQMFKIHHYNRTSKFRNPDQDGEMFEELEEFDVAKQETVDLDNKTECLMLVRAASSNPDQVKVLFEIVRGLELKGVNKEDTNDVYKQLKVFADQAPDVFFGRVKTYKAKVSEVVEKARSFKILDLTQEGKIVATDAKGKRDILIEQVPGKKDEMIEWAFDNFLEPRVFDGIDKLQAITDKLK